MVAAARGKFVQLGERRLGTGGVVGAVDHHHSRGWRDRGGQAREMQAGHGIPHRDRARWTSGRGRSAEQRAVGWGADEHVTAIGAGDAEEEQRLDGPARNHDLTTRGSAEAASNGGDEPGTAATGSVVERQAEEVLLALAGERQQLGNGQAGGSAARQVDGQRRALVGEPSIEALDQRPGAAGRLTREVLHNQGYASRSAADHDRPAMTSYHGGLVYTTRPSIAVIGGSGLYSLSDSADWTTPSTPYGEPSDAIAVVRLGERAVAFLPRHGRTHTIPPHRINHRANIWALHSLGVERVIGPCAVGSLRRDVAPGEVVICDQFIDHTGSRHQATFFDGPEVAHAAMADPYCAELRPLAAEACRRAGFDVHPTGTVTVVPGPRFSTRAESRLFRTEGGDVVNMTQYPEVALARELGMCYVNLALVTDYDAGLDDQPGRPAVTQSQVMELFARHTATLRVAIGLLVADVVPQRRCVCAATRAVPLANDRA